MSKEAVKFWQTRSGVHPLTCSGGGGPGDHQTMLEAIDVEGRAILICPDCGFTQDIPEFVIEFYRRANRPTGPTEMERFKATMDMFRGGA